ncbi:vacuolar ATPase assembly integral membrane protein vma21 [Elasticomyces elasticus]|nr:vacuolar ATPase assembly integral membrane protein vma21 [Elasticomyces elasticus]
MTTRRTAAQTAIPDTDNGSSSSGNIISPRASEKSNITPAVPSSVIAKLLGFTFAMITLPISTYFLTLNTLFSGNSTWAGASAAIIANVVLLSYVVVAFWDDQSERAEMEEQEKKGR